MGDSINFSLHFTPSVELVPGAARAAQLGAGGAQAAQGRFTFYTNKEHCLLSGILLIQVVAFTPTMTNTHHFDVDACA